MLFPSVIIQDCFQKEITQEKYWNLDALFNLTHHIHVNMHQMIITFLVAAKYLIGKTVVEKEIPRKLAEF